MPRALVPLTHVCHAHAMHTPSTRHAHAMHTPCTYRMPCTRHAGTMQVPCTPHTHRAHTTDHALTTHTPYTHHAHITHTPCTRHAHATHTLPSYLDVEPPAVGAQAVALVAGGAELGVQHAQGLQPQRGALWGQSRGGTACSATPHRAAPVQGSPRGCPPCRALLCLLVLCTGSSGRAGGRANPAPHKANPAPHRTNRTARHTEGQGRRQRQAAPLCRADLDTRCPPSPGVSAGTVLGTFWGSSPC